MTKPPTIDAEDCTPGLGYATQVLLDIIADALGAQVGAALRLGAVHVNVLRTDGDLALADAGYLDLAREAVPTLGDVTLALGRMNRDQLANLRAVAKRLGWSVVAHTARQGA